MKIIKTIVLAIPICVALTLTLILYDGFVDSIQKSDVALVLGNKVNRDGSLSERLKSRLDKSIELYKQNFYSNIIVSGGFGREGYDEAIVMKEYLLQKGVDTNSIIVDSQGSNTYLSAVHTDSIMTAHNWESVIVVTNYYHISRSKLALKNRGIKHIYSAHADYFELRDIFSVLREVPANIVYLWK